MLHNQIIGLKALMLLGTITFAMSSCLKDDDIGNNSGRAKIEITDAPVDDPNVKSVFITVVDIKIDGKSWAGFSGKTSFDLLALQNGQTKLLGEGSLDAKTYNEIVLVLDTEADSSGNNFGCYVEDVSGIKHKLEGGSEMVLKAKGSFETIENQTTDVLVDMDLRKTIMYKTGSTTEYQFVTNAELYEAVRLVDKGKTGNIIGTCSDGVSGSDKIIAYAYKTGEYDVNERFPQGTSEVQFKNAVTSSTVGSDGSFNLSFLETGRYEVHFISYETDAQGKLQAKGELQLNVIGSILDLLELNVASRGTISLDLVVTGIIFF
ncbi:MAG: DUF4382 domain-containing protein [Saprospiraceae bacterium]|nr:DUF4382 domain-containing protein [Saprospiraceae bacterium]